MAGLGADYIGGMQTLATAGGQAMGSAKFAEAAATPIINAGLIALTGMGNTMGIGDPEQGDSFGKASEQFDAIHRTLESLAAPDSWEGAASRAYNSSSEKQNNRAQAMKENDAHIKNALDSEGMKIAETRNTIDRMSTVLTGFIPPAIAAQFVPVVGEAVSMSLQLSAVAGTVPTATWAMKYMVQDALHAATLVRRASAGYGEVVSG